MIHKSGLLVLLTAISLLAADVSPWPPQVGQSYPDLEMTDQHGRLVKLSSFKGKVLLLEPVGMNCLACLSWSGTQKHGPYKGLSGQGNLSAIEDMFSQYTGGIALSDPRLVHIQLLLFGTDMKPTVATDAKAWADHFHMNRANQVVLAGSAELLAGARYSATYNLVPGFQLVDKNFILRSDATSDAPKTNLWTELLPLVPKYVKEVR